MEPDTRKEILVPDYHCAMAIEPLLRAGCKPVYYRIRHDCSIDMDDVSSKTRDSTRAILAIHYFGIPQDLRPVRKLCDEAGVYLIEDCAHCCFSKYGSTSIGRLGDIAVFSPRKQFAIFDGGILVVTKPSLRGQLQSRAPSLHLEARAAKFAWDRRAHEANALLPETTTDDSGRRAPATSSHSTDVSLERAVAPWDASFNPRTEDLGMTRVSRWLLLHSPVAAIVSARNRHFGRLAERLDPMPGVVCMDGVAEKDGAPWVFPAIVPGTVDPHRKLRALGIPAAAWDDVVHKSLDLEYRPDARFLYHHLMFLPCHQSLSEADLDELVARVEQLSR
jgi:dTDP-4-amino-4,6-dideoxygalactose transaminase